MISVGIDPGNRDGAGVVLHDRRAVEIIAWWTRTRKRADELVWWRYRHGTAWDVEPMAEPPWLVGAALCRGVLADRHAVEWWAGRRAFAPNPAHIACVERTAAAIYIATGVEPLHAQPAEVRRFIGIRSQRGGARAVDAAVRAWVEANIELPPGIPKQAITSVCDAVAVAWWAQHQEVPR